MVANGLAYAKAHHAEFQGVFFCMHDLCHTSTLQVHAFDVTKTPTPSYRLASMPRILLLFVLLVLTLAGCASLVPTPPPTLTPALVRDLDARGEDGHFTFYSLREDRVVSPADSATTAWDLAFRSTTILVNGGASGPGAGGAVVLTDTTFQAVTEAPPADAYARDRGLEKTETAIPGGAGNGWYAYDFATGIVSPRPVVLGVRTADGHFAKVEVVSYYRGAPEGEDLNPEEGFRYYTFRYLYQPDGSARLQ